MLIQKLPTIKEDCNESESEYDTWVCNEEVDFVENIENISTDEYSCWDEFVKYWCYCLF